MDGYCGKCSGASWIVLGVIVLLNWWFGIVNWWALVGALLVLCGIMHVVKPSCGCGGGCCMPEMTKKKKR